MSKLEMYLIRHGKTEANENKLYCGKSDISLSKNGINEINNIKENTKYNKCDFYYTSGAKRTNETLNILFKDEKYIELKEFWEYDFGDFEMKSYEMLKENSHYIKWICDKEGVISCPNGESKKQYSERIEKAFIELVEYSFKKNHKTICLLCHGGTIGTILEKFYDNSKSFYEHQPKCGGGYKIFIEKVGNKFKISKVIDV